MYQLKIIKLIHTLVWCFMVAVIFFIVYSGLFNAVNYFTWIAIATVVLEGLVLLAFGLSCPLTILARKYSASKKHNFDIYLPEWLARYNKEIFTVIFIIGLFLVVFRIS